GRSLDFPPRRAGRDARRHRTGGAQDQARRRGRRVAPRLAGFPRRPDPVGVPGHPLPAHRLLRRHGGGWRRHAGAVLPACRRAVPHGAGRRARHLRDQPPPRAGLGGVLARRLLGAAVPGDPVHRRARHGAAGDLRRVGPGRGDDLRQDARHRGAARLGRGVPAPAPRNTGRLAAHPVRQRRRFPVRGDRARADGGVLPAAAGPRRRPRRRGADVATRGGRQPGPDGRVGLDRRGPPGAGQPAALHRLGRGHAGAGPRHLAPLPQGRGEL
ncbi:MAG: hypothetical protein AVDCRST_MAG08-3932, partial [uncultured Acetobacteraceae bacterium]